MRHIERAPRRHDALRELERIVGSENAPGVRLAQFHSWRTRWVDTVGAQYTVTGEALIAGAAPLRDHYRRRAYHWLADELAKIYGAVLEETSEIPRSMWPEGVTADEQTQFHLTVLRAVPR